MPPARPMGGDHTMASAIRALKQAQARLSPVGATRATENVPRRLKSADGALRHSQLLLHRQQWRSGVPE
jgi:hypothetical protein